MTMHKKILLALLALAPAAAFADISWYVGGGVGGMKLEEDVDVAIGAFTNDGSGLTPVICPSDPSSQQLYGCTPGDPVQKRLSKFSGTDLGYRVFAGMRFAQYFGVEVGYVDLGSPEDSLDLAVPPLPGGASPEIDASLKLSDSIHGMDAYLVGYWPFSDKWEAVAKVGAIHWDSTFKIRNYYSEFVENPGQPALPIILPDSFSVDTDGTDLAGAIGVNYKATDHMTLRAEGTWYDIEDTEKAWLLGGFVIYNF